MFSISDTVLLFLLQFLLQPFLPFKLSIILHARHTISAVIKLIIVYTIVATKKFKLLIINVTIKKIANTIADTK